MKNLAERIAHRYLFGVSRAQEVQKRSSTKKRLGYKVMRYDPKTKRAVSGADSRLSFPVRRGVFRMPRKGIFLSLNRDYVIDYYATHDWNIVLTFEFDPSRILFGNLTDRETEFSVPEAKLVGWKIFQEE